ncbi:helix-turn-helix domain-containing protein [Paenibacillus sp. N3.4]|uniref:winged helix-turn-helix transcriptional regulator n=1 Tax=Paenibacillus sp. N3.4 TaxID=2603222 RepID=UPI0011C873C6|nr:winged helix-turn-helix transcriptional regulator [Paenibacillus sp. N3.4]TXK76769.1 winged helix-turn-helix transcriptional regulator [Paenibacillus sp. N3.4]
MKFCYNELEICLKVIGGKWKSLILYHLHFGPKRTNELQKLVINITQKMLIQSLRELENDGIVRRTMYNQVPPKVEYSLTELGVSLHPILVTLAEWGGMYKDQLITESESQNFS